MFHHSFIMRRMFMLVFIALAASALLAAVAFGIAGRTTQFNYSVNEAELQYENIYEVIQDTADELTLLTTTRMRRDSIRTQYEALGMKIRYIRKKQKELESEASKVEKSK